MNHSPLNYVLLSVFLMSGCQSMTRQYQDNTELERPPLLAETPKITVATNEIVGGDKEADKPVAGGLGDTVKQIDAKHLRLQQPFAMAWSSVEKALKLAKIEILDRNQELGGYYVNYILPSDTLPNGSADLEDTSNNEYSIFSWLQNRGPTVAFFVVLQPLQDAVDIQVRQANEQPNQGNSPIPNNANQLLLQKLYRTLRDDLILE